MDQIWIQTNSFIISHARPMFVLNAWKHPTKSLITMFYWPTSARPIRTKHIHDKAWTPRQETQFEAMFYSQQMDHNKILFVTHIIRMFHKLYSWPVIGQMLLILKSHWLTTASHSFVIINHIGLSLIEHVHKSDPSSGFCRVFRAVWVQLKQTPI